MATLHDTKTPLTADNVSTWARANFPDSYEKLCKAPDSKWLEFDVKNSKSIGPDRAVYRHLKRTEHNRLLIVGRYAPGPASEEPSDKSDRVAAHVHADPAEVRFFRIGKAENGSRLLEDVNSTSAVDFESPFCDVGDGQGDHRAGHRVTALIEWYFLDAGHVKELARSDGDPSKFTRNFRQACLWVGNGGKQPMELLPRRPSGVNMDEDTKVIAVRPKRSSTTTSGNYRNSPIDNFRSPLKRSATDSNQIKRQRGEDVPSRPTKRRTLSEQITPATVSHLQKSTSIPSSPRFATLDDAERVNRALGSRIIDLNARYTDLKLQCYEVATRQEVLEEELGVVRKEVKSLRTQLEEAEREMAKLKAEVEGGSNGSGRRPQRR